MTTPVKLGDVSKGGKSEPPRMARCHECEQALRMSGPQTWHANCPAEEKYCTDINIRCNDAEGSLVAVVPKGSANARLIAAAPEMWDFIQRVWQAHCRGTHFPNDLSIPAVASEIWHKVTGEWPHKTREAAIAKATEGGAA